jgi:hypothetical protein
MNRKESRGPRFLGAHDGSRRVRELTATFTERSQLRYPSLPAVHCTKQVYFHSDPLGENVNCISLRLGSVPEIDMQRPRLPLLLPDHPATPQDRSKA